MPTPFVLLDDARTDGAAPARLYREPVDVVVARTGDEVLPALERLRALSRDGYEIAGYLSYEAGLALEPRLQSLVSAHRDPASPLLWFGAFAGCESIAPGEVDGWLAGQAGNAEPAIGPLDPTIAPGDYIARFGALQDAIQAGDIYQANLTFPLAGSWRGDPIALYAALRASGAAGYGALIHDGAQWLLSFSPELFFALRGRDARVKPMKGTRPRATDPATDTALREELATSIKDRAENLMIVDLMRNDLARVAVPGSVKVERPFTVESYPTVHQMVSTVHATLRDELDAIDMLRALFPCGSITGAPKIRAMELIAATEPDPRGPYCGAIGGIDASGDAAFNVAIRTLRLSGAERGDGKAVLGVGSAIVADSEGLAEWRECLVKGGFVRPTGQGSPAQFDLIETMRFTPEEGIVLLDRHLERIGASAATLGFTFDRHAVRNAVQALCFDADVPSRLRLVLGRSGAFSLELGEMPLALPEVLKVAVFRLPVDESDWRLRHKSSDRGFYEAGLEAAKDAGADEAIFVRDDGLVTEGTFTNVFLARDDKLLTPPCSLGLLPGVLRGSLLASGEAAEASLALDELAGGFQLGNALRGLMRAELLA
ncbi:aminodeoxychorismate synthase component I [Novosphingobium aquimarinum]|uniref:aminodeoxychorismate synthase component I n=1 Tax=Novosphingobium aquimarinum TaxID=2682494 RepID=UPI0012EBD198|nr:aminodeoxychorismate synthase component I [Novosphingobium aquimarinum]